MLLLLVPSTHTVMQASLRRASGLAGSEPTVDGRQWWDAGSLRWDRDGFVSVLSRYTTETDEDVATLGTLVVMQIDCDSVYSATSR